MEQNDDVFVIMPEQQRLNNLAALAAQQAAQAAEQTPPQRPVNNNNRKKNGGNNRQNFFRRQEKKFGDNWMRTYNKYTDRDIVNIVQDMIRGNIEVDDINYFYDNNLNFAMRTVIFNKLTLARYRVQTDMLYLDYLRNNGMQIMGPHQQYIDEDQIVLNIWAAMNDYLIQISQLSMYGREQVVDFTINNFIPSMRNKFGRFVYLL